MVEAIKQKAEELTLGASSKRDASGRIIEFVRNQIKYNLDEWDVPAPGVLNKRAGMCAGKALLASELHRAANIATQFKTIKIQSEGGLLDWLFRLIRHNIKRGRHWNLSDVLSRGSADCLGFARLFSFLGKAFGLETGVIEVLRDNRGAYDHIRIIDMADEKASFCSKLLADLGAEVIKVEKPGGDPARRIGPFWKDGSGSEKSLFFEYHNTNKLGITLDIEGGSDKEILRRLIRRADVLVETYSPGYLGEIGLGFELRGVEKG